MSSVHSLCDHIVQLVHEAGACAAGFSEAAPLSSAELAVFDHWIASGRHAGMEYMERYGDLRADPRTLLDGTCSILSVAFAYAPAPHRHPLIADYALGEDYHTALRTMLHPVASAMEAAVPGSTTRICIDTAPIRERVWAVRARLGFIGLNNLLIVPASAPGYSLPRYYGHTCRRFRPNHPCPQAARAAWHASRHVLATLSTATEASTRAAACRTSPSSTAESCRKACRCVDGASTGATYARMHVLITVAQIHRYPRLSGHRPS